ncbi:MAG TPA: hypothetical protein VGW75_09405 [Solirubrobacteraceae bacterium]|jgi:hypothetical protein|nr:hypothetical protein [Solirubrobacteraceae bacterium]
MHPDVRRLVADRTRDFAGRGWFLDAAAAWLRARDRRALVVVGEPGCGKTALAARLLQLSLGEVTSDREELSPGFVSAAHFCSWRDPRWNDPIRFARSVAEQLAATSPAFAEALVEEASGKRIEVGVHQVAGHVGGDLVAVAIAQLVVGHAVPEQAFSELVAGPLERTLAVDPDRRVLLLVDALDESLTPGRDTTIASLVVSLRHLPDRVRLVVTTRPDVRLERQLDGMGRLTLELSPDDRHRIDEDVREYVRGRITPAMRDRIDPSLGEEGLVARCADRADGNFLFARFLLATLERSEGRLDEATLETAPASLEESYLALLERLADATSERWRERARPLLGTLAVARAAVGERQLAAWLERPPDDVRSDLTELRQVLDDQSAGGERRYALYHRSFAEFLLDDERAQEYWVAAAPQHQRIARWYLANHGDDWAEADDYGIAHVVAHLHDAGDDAAVLDLVQAPFLAAKATRSGSIRPALEELRRGLAAALRSGRMSAAARMVAAHALLKRRVRDLPRSAIPLYAAAGQIDRALELAAVIDRPIDRRGALWDTVKHLLPERHEQAATIAALIEEPGMRAEAQLLVLQASAHALAPGELVASCRALADALVAGSAPHYASHGLRRLSRVAQRADPAVAAALAERAETVMEHPPDAFMAAEALAALARHVREDDPRRAIALLKRAAVLMASEREHEVNALVTAGYVAELFHLEPRAARDVLPRLDARLAWAHAVIRLLHEGGEARAPLAQARAALDAVRSLTKAEAYQWKAHAAVFLGAALAEVDPVEGAQLIDRAPEWARTEGLAEVMKEWTLDPATAGRFASQIGDHVKRSNAIVEQGRRHLAAGDADAALAVARVGDERGSRARLTAAVAASLVGVDPERARALAREVAAVGVSGPHALDVARELAKADRDAATRVLDRALTAARDAGAAERFLLEAAEAALALGDSRRALDLVRETLVTHRGWQARSWLADAEAALVAEAVRRDDPAADALRRGPAGAASEAALAGAATIATAERDVDAALALLPALAGDDAEGRALAAIVLAAAATGDARTVELAERFFGWRDNAWYDFKADTAARAAAALAATDRSAAEQLVELALTHPYGDWRHVAHATERILHVHPAPQRFAEHVLATATRSNIDEHVALIAGAVARTCPELAVLCSAPLAASPEHRARVHGALAAVAASEEERERLLREALASADSATPAWRQLDARTVIAQLVGAADADRARALLDEIAAAIGRLDQAYVRAAHLADVAAVHAGLGDDDAAVGMLEKACAQLPASSGTDAAYALDTIRDVLAATPDGFVRRAMPELLRAVQVTDDVVLNRFGSFLALLVRAGDEPPAVYLDELLLADATAEAAFVS